MVTDLNVPPMPSHLTFQQTRNFLGALAKGDPEAAAAILQTARELVGSILPDKDGGLSAAFSSSGPKAIPGKRLRFFSPELRKNKGLEQSIDSKKR
jgi:hypothetical protein